HAEAASQAGEEEVAADSQHGFESKEGGEKEEAAPGAEKDEERRPEEVELALDGEAPGVSQQPEILRHGWKQGQGVVPGERGRGRPMRPGDGAGVVEAPCA